MSLLQERASTEELHDLARELDGRPVPQLRMTEAEFESWCDEDIKAEWVDGEVIVMAPVSGEHADLSLWLLRLVSEVVDSGNFGVVRGPEFQVRLGAQRRRRTPDLFFVTKARTRMLRRTYLDGAPDLIMEVVSPDSESRDWRDKYIDYQSAAVREYWIVDPLSQRVEAYTLGRNRKYRRLNEVDGKLPSKVLRRLHIRPGWLWRSPLPKLAVVLRELRLRT